MSTGTFGGLGAHANGRFGAVSSRQRISLMGRKPVPASTARATAPKSAPDVRSWAHLRHRQPCQVVVVVGAGDRQRGHRQQDPKSGGGCATRSLGMVASLPGLNEPVGRCCQPGPRDHPADVECPAGFAGTNAPVRLLLEVVFDEDLHPPRGGMESAMAGLRRPSPPSRHAAGDGLPDQGRSGQGCLWRPAWSRGRTEPTLVCGRPEVVHGRSQAQRPW